MRTTKTTNEAIPFNTGMLVNRIFHNGLNGSQQSPKALKDSLDYNSKKDKYKNVKTNAVEEHLKMKARRQGDSERDPNNKSPFFDMPNLKPVSSQAKDRDYVDQNNLINLSLKPK